MTRVLLVLFAAAVLFAGCVSAPLTSFDSDSNYAAVFSGMVEPKPLILNTRLERYSKNFGLVRTRERNGEWEFEIIASRTWVEEVKRGFVPAAFTDSSRHPEAAWWAPDEKTYDAFRMPYSSYSAAHLYVEKHPKDKDRIHVFIQRH